MATLPAEQVTQRNKIGVVAVTDGSDTTTVGETIWLSTTTLPYTVVNTKTTASNQQDPDELDGRVMAEWDAEQDISEYTMAYANVPIVNVGDGTEALAVANEGTSSINIEPFVYGTFKPFTYELDPATEEDFGTPTLSGSVLQYVAGAVAGTDTVLVIVTDRGGNSVQVSVDVTVAAP